MNNSRLLVDTLIRRLNYDKTTSVLSVNGEKLLKEALVTDFPAMIEPAEFVSVLGNLAPRLYSVASSPLAFMGELHLTAVLIEYKENGREHRGVCSTYFADRVETGSSVPVFLERLKIERRFQMDLY